MCSRPVCALTDSPPFINSHLRRSLISNTNRIIITASIDATTIFHLPFDLRNSSPTFINHPFKHSGAHFLASCNGLFLLLTATTPHNCVLESVVVPDPPNLNLALVNPATRNYKLLPVSPIHYPACDFITYGFGYDSVNDDYNVVRIAQFPDVKMNEVKIYSLKFNEWRRGEDCPYRLGCTTQAVYLNGALHFMDFVPTQFGFELPGFVALDLATEEYRSIPQPPYSGSLEFMVILTVLGGKLFMNCNYDGRHSDLWVMENYGVGESWTKILTVVQNVDLQFLQLKPLAYANNGKKVLLLKDTGQLIWYDLELKVIKMESNPVIPEFWKAYVSLESLVKLSSGHSTSMPQVRKKTKKRYIFSFYPLYHFFMLTVSYLGSLAMHCST